MTIAKKLLSLAFFAGVLAAGASGMGQVQAYVNRAPSFSSGSIFSKFVMAGSSPAAPVSINSQAQAAINQVSPAVVAIYGFTAPVQSASQTFYLPFFHISITLPQQQAQVDAGTGFFIDPRGYILTSNHVVSKSRVSYKAQLADGTIKPITVIYQNPDADIAILKIPGNNYPVVPLGDSSGLAKGQIVVGMGNALGEFTNLPSIGSIVALHQDITPGNGDTADQKISDLFQSSMQLYPGDSGGPTFDLAGNVVGINDAIATNQRNVSFSIPINAAKQAITDTIPQES